MALKLNEVAISKCVSVKLAPDTIAIIALMYHTADRKAYPDDKSFYRYEGRVCKISDLEAEIQTMKDEAHRLEDWKWPNPTWPKDWFMGYDGGNSNMKGQRFYSLKIKKALSWEAYEKLVKDGIKTLGNGKEKYYPTAKYLTDGYIDQDGQTFSILDRDALLARLGKYFSKNIPLRRLDAPKAPAA